MMKMVIGKLNMTVHQNDQELFEQFKDGDQSLYNRYYLLVYHLALGYLKHRQDAEDLTQDVFISLYRAPYCVQRGSLASYLKTITHSRAIDRLRSKSVAVKYQHYWQQLNNDTNTVTPFDHAVAQENQYWVRNALMRLPIAQRQLLALAYYGELSQRKIAQAVKVPLGTVKYRMRQGLITLRQHLQLRVR